MQHQDHSHRRFTNFFTDPHRNDARRRFVIFFFLIQNGKLINKKNDYNNNKHTVDKRKRVGKRELMKYRSQSLTGPTERMKTQFDCRVLATSRREHTAAALLEC